MNSKEEGGLLTSGSDEDDDEFASGSFPKSELDIEALAEKLVLSGERKNIADEFSVSNTFLLDGDSLLLFILFNSSVDVSYGGQYLHLVYAVERFLGMLYERGAVLVIIFFENTLKLWNENPTLLLARPVIHTHLEKNSPCRVLSFPSSCHVDFQNRMNASVLCHSGEVDAKRIPAIIPLGIISCLKLEMAKIIEILRTRDDLDFTKIADLMDGRMFLKMLTLAKKEKTITVTQPVHDHYMELSRCFKKAAPLSVVTAREILGEKPEVGEADTLPIQAECISKSVLLVQKFLPDFHAPLSDNLPNLPFLKEVAWGDTDMPPDSLNKYHYHVGKEILTEKETAIRNARKPKDYWEQRIENTQKHKQKLVKFMRFYGDSLEGRDVSEQIAVVEQTIKRKKTGVSKKGELIKNKNTKKKKEEQKQRELQQFREVKEKWKLELKRFQFETVRKEITVKMKQFQDVEIQTDLLILRLCVSMKLWRKDSVSTTVSIFMDIRKLLEETREILKPRQMEKITEVLNTIGFPDILQKLKLSNNDVKRKDGESSIRFQMLHMGPHLKREYRTDPDPRINKFIPDTWQRQMFDAIDMSQSMLIVAPTSSGKTYASYYCIRKVLQMDNESVVVYVAPTKALVNQVAATVYARFNQKVMPAGKAVLGVFTRDYRENVLNSQVLIVVPEA
ncbi:unnamed protein product, partial [Darwinula stevensoni]